MRAAQKRETLGIRTAFRALRHRNFRLFASGQLISLIGTWMQTVAQSWLVYRMTGSSLLLGTVGFASQIPVFLVSPLGGLVADRADRRRVVMATQAASMALAALLAFLTLAGHVRVWHVITVLFRYFIAPGLRLPMSDRRPGPVRMRLALESLGGAWLKLGQMLAPGLSLCILLGPLVIVSSFLLCLVYVLWANRVFDPALRDLDR